ncbi:hypothetical protein GCM10009665_33470 [Kitasatospora nipponensis]|uniref:Antitoxin n=1 Tax=Kitasatospora nipponensis TaxID=258049 RepID=A0ABP4GW64_9ACTN
MTIQLELPEQLEEYVAEQAARAGLSPQDYVIRLLSADQSAAAGTREARIDRAGALASAAYRAWNAAGRPEAGALTTDEVFG